MLKNAKENNVLPIFEYLLIGGLENGNLNQDNALSPLSQAAQKLNEQMKNGLLPSRNQPSSERRAQLLNELTFPPSCEKTMINIFARKTSPSHFEPIARGAPLLI